MARTARTLSRSNIYHIMLRGINRQNIFEEDEDRICFMSILKNCKSVSGFRLHAFALMSNHVHLLIETSEEPLNTIFRRIGTRYAGWYNKKYQRTGHLFQDRFRSENIENDLYFTTVLRYIIQNPMKAGLERSPGSYRWSSFLAYKEGKGFITDTQFAMSLFKSREELVGYLTQNNDDHAMDEADCDRYLREEQAKEKMFRLTNCASISDFQKLDGALQKEYAGIMYQGGLSLGQISRMTGMPKSSVYKTVKKMEEQSDSEREMILREEETLEYFPFDDMIW